MSKQELRERLAGALYDWNAEPGMTVPWKHLNDEKRDRTGRRSMIDAILAELDAAGYAVVDKDHLAMIGRSLMGGAKEIDERTYPSESEARFVGAIGLGMRCNANVIARMLAATKGETDASG